jgi:hypothetical protein
MPISPKKGQTQNQFMDHCMHEVTHNRKTKRNHDQRIAICLSYWNKANEDTIVDKLDSLLIEQDCPEGQKW